MSQNRNSCKTSAIYTDQKPKWKFVPQKRLTMPVAQYHHFSSPLWKWWICRIISKPVFLNFIGCCCVPSRFLSYYCLHMNPPFGNSHFYLLKSGLFFRFSYVKEFLSVHNFACSSHHLTCFRCLRYELQTKRFSVSVACLRLNYFMTGIPLSLSKSGTKKACYSYKIVLQSKLFS